MAFYRAAYDFKAEDAQELQLEKSDLVYVNDGLVDGGEDWGKGYSLRLQRVGEFPVSFVTLVDSGACSKFRAKFDFGKEKEDEIDFKKDDVIACMPDQDPEGEWLQGLNTRTMMQGQFPTNYCKRIEKGDADVKPTPKGKKGEGSTKNGKAKAKGEKGKITAKINIYFKALHDFTAESTDEIDLAEGDIIAHLTSVGKHVLGEWKRGENTRTKNVGLFPVNYCEEIGEAEANAIMTAMKLQEEAGAAVKIQAVARGARTRRETKKQVSKKPPIKKTTKKKGAVATGDYDLLEQVTSKITEQMSTEINKRDEVILQLQAQMKKMQELIDPKNEKEVPQPLDPSPIRFPWTRKKKKKAIKPKIEEEEQEEEVQENEDDRESVLSSSSSSVYYDSPVPPNRRNRRNHLRPGTKKYKPQEVEHSDLLSNKTELRRRFARSNSTKALTQDDLRLLRDQYYNGHASAKRSNRHLKLDDLQSDAVKSAIAKVKAFAAIPAKSGRFDLKGFQGEAVDAHELRRQFKLLHVKLDEEEAGALVNLWDTDGTNRVDYTEFLYNFHKWRREGQSNDAKAKASARIYFPSLQRKRTLKADESTKGVLKFKEHRNNTRDQTTCPICGEDGHYAAECRMGAVHTRERKRAKDQRMVRARYDRRKLTELRIPRRPANHKAAFGGRAKMSDRERIRMKRQRDQYSLSKNGRRRGLRP